MCLALSLIQVTFNAKPLTALDLCCLDAHCFIYCFDIRCLRCLHLLHSSSLSLLMLQEPIFLICADQMKQPFVFYLERGCVREFYFLYLILI